VTLFWSFEELGDFTDSEGYVWLSSQHDIDQHTNNFSVGILKALGSSGVC
jgi:hypothetical protein